MQCTGHLFSCLKLIQTEWGACVEKLAVLSSQFCMSTSYHPILLTISFLKKCFVYITSISLPFTPSYSSNFVFFTNSQKTCSLQLRTLLGLNLKSFSSLIVFDSLVTFNTVNYALLLKTLSLPQRPQTLLDFLLRSIFIRSSFSCYPYM